MAHFQLSSKKFKKISLLTTVALFNLTEPRLNEPIKTLEVQQEYVGAIAYYGLYPDRTALTLGLGKVT